MAFALRDLTAELRGAPGVPGAPPHLEQIREEVLGEQLVRPLLRGPFSRDGVGEVAISRGISSQVASLLSGVAATIAVLVIILVKLI